MYYGADNVIQANGRTQRGIALISVLWVIVLLSTLVFGIAASVRTETTLVGNSISLSRARYAAEGGVSIGVQNLLLPRAERWPADGSIRELDFDQLHLRIATFDESGKIDLNYADQDLLVRLLNLAGAEQTAAFSIADAIIDWRDADDLHRLQGAEAEDYRAAGLGYGPRNGPFETVGELQLVMGMDPELYERIKPALTVYSGSAGVNLELASAQVVAALAGFEQLHAGAGDSVFTLHVDAQAPDGVRAELAVTLRLVPGRPMQPYDVLVWERPRRSIFAAPGTGADQEVM